MLYATGSVFAPPLAGQMSPALGLSPALALFSGLSVCCLLLVRRVEEVR
ncbi:hypothetical protein ABID21_002341 [Pseudorhizobium tarimense]|uniref:MFS transporter, DHA1 family, bicyclomycin/chloramphenicol resistance protein n=1 Tax=Pseudorhizobium tarimense TaxID=1079109 RepID=A0ABV2H713_9HYPH